MSFATLQFLAFCLVAVALLRLAPLGMWHQLALAMLSIGFAVSFATDPLQLVPLAAFALGGYGAVLAAARLGTGAGLGVLAGVLVLVFGWLRHYAILGFIPPLPIVYVMVGMPYILMRVLHLMVDVAQGALPPPSPLRFFNYNFSFLTFVSGPIQRYEEHEAQLTARVPMDSARFHAALGRILLGYLMISILSVMTAKILGKAEPKFFAAVAAGFNPSALALYLLTALVYFAHLYFNFVGYMHIVIGVGIFAGFALPENFNHPLKSENFLDLWTRWHMTLGNWFKLYVFNPVMKLLAAWQPGPRLMPYLGAVAYFVTFFLLGLWHGSTFTFVICGLVIGAGVTVNKLWQTWMAARLGRDGYRTLRQKRWYKLLSRGLTLGYFAFTLTTLWADDTQLGLFFSASGLAVLAVGTLVMSLLALPLIPLCDALYAVIARLRTDRLFASDTARAAWSASLIFLLVYFVMQMNAGAPDFIYQGF